MIEYLNLLNQVYNEGICRQDRTGVGTIGIFGTKTVYRNVGRPYRFPLLTTKKLHWKSIVHELLWFLKGDTNTKYLEDNGVTIWNEWKDENGDLGRVYGAQWRDWISPDGRHIDQISNLIDGLKRDPFSRRHIVTAWNPGELQEMALPPCHMFFQCYVESIPGRKRNVLHMQLYVRSQDCFLGAPYNIASYSLLLMMIAEQCDMIPGDLIHVTGDTHIYRNHVDQVNKQRSRRPLILPTVELNHHIKSIFDYTFDDIKLIGYNPHPAIKAPVAV